jgi:hypothetical protein
LTLLHAAHMGAQVIEQRYFGYVMYQEAEDDDEVVTVGAVRIGPTESYDEISVEGRDRLGRPWTVYMKTAVGIGSSLGWVADLDHDGAQDLIFMHRDLLNGRCTDRSRLDTILFDSEGRPSPWQIEGYFLVDHSWDENDGQGILDLGDWNGNGRAELLQTACYSYSYQQLGQGAYGFLDVYEAKDGRWSRLSPDGRGRFEKTYLELAGREHRKLMPRPEGGTGFDPDYSNDGAAESPPQRLVKRVKREGRCPPFRFHFRPSGDGRFPQLAIPTPEEEHADRLRCEDHFVLADGRQCFGAPSVHLKTPEETVAVMDGGLKRSEALVDRIIREQIPVRLTGQLQEGICSPAAVWAEAP